MKILVVHNRYRLAGGEDLTAEREAALLRRYGHDVHEWMAENSSITRAGAGLAINTIWSQPSYRTLLELARRLRPDVVHFHNTLPLVSPSGYYAVRRVAAAVVQTVQNYRLSCANGLLLRGGQICEACIDSPAPWRSVVHGCYRDSRSASAVVTAMVGVHKLIGTWRTQVDTYIAPTAFVSDTLIRAGVPSERVAIKPNFVSEPVESASPDRSDTYLFVGRISQEKGVRTLVDAWRQLGAQAPHLKIVGSGPLLDELRSMTASLGSVHVLGSRTPQEVASLMAEAAALVVPSLWHEAFPLVVVEAYAAGIPVLASGTGSLGEIVSGGGGRLVTPADPSLLAQAVRELRSSPTLRGELGNAARRRWAEEFSESINHRQLVSIYEKAMSIRGLSRRTPAT